jgi:uncharacterized protein YjiS (DUF1127 family)
MSDWHNETPDFQHYVDQAHGARSEAMARTGYLAVAAVGGIVGAATAAVRSALAAAAAWRDRQAALRELLLLDDRMLRDIGLTRADARAAVDGALRNRTPDLAAPRPAAYVDIALSSYAVAGCNDNGERRRVA